MVMSPTTGDQRRNYSELGLRITRVRLGFTGALGIEGAQGRQWTDGEQRQWCRRGEMGCGDQWGRHARVVRRQWQIRRLETRKEATVTAARVMEEGIYILLGKG